MDAVAQEAGGKSKDRCNLPHNLSELVEASSCLWRSSLIRRFGFQRGVIVASRSQLGLPA